jgi:hypothetical protein
MAKKRATDPTPSQPHSGPKLKVLETNFADMRTGQLMVIPTSELIREAIEDTSFGQALSLTDLRKALAARTQAEVACPVTTSIFLRKLIQAEWSASQTQSDRARKNSSTTMLPFWRVINQGMPLFKKLEPAVQAFILAQRKDEGL